MGLHSREKVPRNVVIVRDHSHFNSCFLGSQQPCLWRLATRQAYAAAPQATLSPSQSLYCSFFLTFNRTLSHKILFFRTHCPH